MATIAVLGTLDSKGYEHAFVADRIRERGHQSLLIDVGTLKEAQVKPDISSTSILEFAGIELPEMEDRGQRVGAMAKALPLFLAHLAAEQKIDAVISLGGGGGTAIATAGMRALPIGFPKLMVSTLASGHTAHYVGTKDIVMFPSIVDVAGLNVISETIFSRAAGAICGMVEAKIATGGDQPLIVASMFGNTTECVEHARQLLESAGYEVLVFHATGAGGRTMESLIESGMVAGVLDITTTELADELVGGVLTAGPKRLEAAGKQGIPTIVTPGCLDMANFGERNTVPDAFEHRNLYVHNPQVTLLRTNVEECAHLGKILSEKINAYTGPVTVLLPKKAISIISAEGQPFHDPDADRALFDAIRQNLSERVKLVELDVEINAPEFASACAEELRVHLKQEHSPQGK
jgi:uncharacterized protein (UPF0261 family)